MRYPPRVGLADDGRFRAAKKCSEAKARGCKARCDGASCDSQGDSDLGLS